MQEGSRILEGIKVLDVATFIFGPAAATVMSDFGADVIKIEHPKIGDPYRYLTAMAPMPTCGHNYCWLLTGRNKRSVGLDLTKPEAREVLRKLAAGADVLDHQLPSVGARQARDALGGPAAAQRSADLRAGLGLRRDRRRGGEAGLRRVGVVGPLGADGRGARAGRRARLVDAGHGRSPERDGAPLRDHDGALPARAHRQGRQGVELADGQRRVVEQLPDPGRAVRLGPLSADEAARSRPTRWSTSTAPATAATSSSCCCMDERDWPRLATAIGRPDLLADPRFLTKASRTPERAGALRRARFDVRGASLRASGATCSTATTSPSARWRSPPKRSTIRRCRPTASSPSCGATASTACAR